jgi:hypothetical protein
MKEDRSYSVLLKSISKIVGTPPCDRELCSARRWNICADNNIGCAAWKVYVNTGKVDIDKIGRFKDTMCERCKRERHNCVRSCHRMRA